MTEKRFPTRTKHMCVLYVDTGKKLTRKEIIEQMMNQKPIISDEEAFLRHLMEEHSIFSDLTGRRVIL